MPNTSKNKGSRVERELVLKHKRQGIPCIRVPLSGGGSISGDLLIGPHQEYRAEVKARKTGAGFAVLEGWLKGNDILILKKDFSEPFVAMTWQMYIELMQPLTGDENDEASR